MIYSLNGEVTHIEQNFIVIECAGVGYACHTTANVVSNAEVGRKTKLYTYLNLRENAVDLFGFADENELNCFKMLIGVSGLGPKGAVAMLSALSPQEFALAVVNEDAKTLSLAQGVGKKLAEKIIFELKDKLAKRGDFDISGISDTKSGVISSNNFSEAATALMVLGFTTSQAQNALSGLSSDMTVQELIKEALKRLSGK